MKLAVVGISDYDPWQQVYALVGRLPEGEDVTVGSIDNRVGGFLKKAAVKHDFDYREFTHGPAGLGKMARWCDGAVALWRPGDMGHGWVIVRQFIRKVAAHEKPWWDICRDHYGVDADAIEAWAKLQVHKQEEETDG